MKNTVVFVIGVGLVVWAIHDLTAPGDVQSTGAVVMNVISLMAGCAIAVGAILLKVRAGATKP